MMPFALSVLAHPGPQSFTHAMAQAAQAVLPETCFTSTYRRPQAPEAGGSAQAAAAAICRPGSRVNARADRKAPRPSANAPTNSQA